MELWIRSQAKNKLRKIESVEIKEFEEGYGIVEFIDFDKYHPLGIYKTKERTLEVLDEIQNILKPQMILTNVGKVVGETCDGTVYREPDEFDFKEISTYVYEMPKE